MSKKKREPLVDIDQMVKIRQMSFPTHELKTIYEAARAKDAELIQQLVDGVIGVYWMRPEASKKLMTELLATAEAAGFKPSDE